MLNKILLVAAAVLTGDADPVASSTHYRNDIDVPINRGKLSMISDLRERAVCKFDVETEVDADSQITYQHVKCVNEAFGDCEQLQTSLTLASGRSLTIMAGCVSVSRTVSSEQAKKSKEIPPKVS
jgi:hypothetical protein